MIVTCPNCQTKFEIPDDKYRPGRKARCSNCGHVFVLPEIGPDGTPLPAILADPPPPIEDYFASKDTPVSQGEQPVAKPDSISAPFEPSAAQGESGASFDALDDKSDPGSSADVVLPTSVEKQKSNNKRKLFFILGLVLVLSLLGYGGFMVYSALFTTTGTNDPARATSGRLTRSLGGKSTQADEEKEAARQAAVRRLALENVTQHTVTDNEKTGPMVVIEGAVVNNFDTPKSLILLEITLYDEKGNALVLREQYCGIALSLLQLRTLSKAALESALSNQVNILNNNVDILPGGKVPFVTVFFDLPKAAYEFEVKIVDVQDTAQKK